MKKVLILAYDFPPYVSVGGLRPYNWFKYFHEFGVYPVVVTRQWDNKYGNELDYISRSEATWAIIDESAKGTIIRVPYEPNYSNRLLLKYGKNRYKFIRKLITAYFEFLQFILPIGTKRELYKAANNYLIGNKVDVIIATGDPFILFKYASDLGRKFKIPWIGDYRDLWSQEIYIQKKPLLRRWSSYFERKIVNTAATLTTVDDFFATKISSIIPDVSCQILSNGYDPEVVRSIENIPQQKNELRISFIGTIYDWHPIESFLTVFKEYITANENANIKLHFYGVNSEEELNQLIDTKFFKIKEHVRLFPKMKNNVLLAKIAEDNVMLLFNYYSFMGTKIYDYLGVNRKILFCYENDNEANELKRKYYKLDDNGSKNSHVQADLVRKTKSGIVVKDARHLYGVFQDLCTEFSNNQYIACESTGIEKYSRKIKVKELAGIVKQLY